MKALALLGLLVSLVPAQHDPGCKLPEKYRLDCWPEQTNVDESSCNARGCCWQPASTQGPPYCYYGTNGTQYGYTMGAISENSTSKSTTAYLLSPYPHVPNQISQLKFEAFYETNSRLRLKISDANQARYEIPQDLVQRPADGETASGTNPDYEINFEENGFKIDISRRNGDRLMLASFLNFIYADQFLQVTWLVPAKRLYGLGEHRAPLMWDLDEWQQIGFWARDIPPQENANLYGSHPMYIMIDNKGEAHGVILMNSNAMDVTLQPAPAVTWRTIGGILDFYILTGPEPADVVRQYLDLIGRPLMPPYWGLGFNLCRWGYYSSNATWDVVRKLRALEFPQEVQWNDIDYMDSYMDFTYDPINFDTLPQMVEDLHNHTQRYIMILDPGISDDLPSSALESGNKMHVWINKTDGTTPLEGQVWPGNVYYPDFTGTNTQKWWSDHLNKFHEMVPFDGVWIDMNEPSNFVQGSTSHPACTRDQYDNPPYTPKIVDNSLSAKTICPSSVQAAGRHYNVHNMYGHSEGMATRMGLNSLFGNNRSIIVSRSTFMSSGLHVAHWTGDNNAAFDNMHWSISSTINTNLFGVSMTGADICGFFSDTTEELCTRWMSMGAFYTFMRNHNTYDAIAQDPSVWSEDARQIMKKYVMLRYSYLPYLYTELYLASTKGKTVLSSLAFEFPGDIQRTAAIDDQFMWGPAVMVAPVMKEGAVSREVYFPASNFWYDLETFEVVSEGLETLNVSAPLSKLPLYGRGGHIVVRQTPELYLSQTRQNPFALVVFAGTALGYGTGALFWDDGETDTLSSGEYSLVEFAYQLDCSYAGYLTSKVVSSKYREMPVLQNITFVGFQQAPQYVTINKQEVPFQYDPVKLMLSLPGVNLDLLTKFLVNWQ